MTQDATEARWARFSKFRSVDLLNLRPHHRARKLAADPAPFYTAWTQSYRRSSFRLDALGPLLKLPEVCRTGPIVTSRP
jgi:hypothetical protein